MPNLRIGSCLDFAPSGQIRVEEFSQGKPWAKLSAPSAEGAALLLWGQEPTQFPIFRSERSPASSENKVA
jgi:hypothetical protein